MKVPKKSYLINIIAILALYGLLFLLIQTGIINRYYSKILLVAGINIILAVSLNLAVGCLGELMLGHAGFMSVGAYAAALFTKAVLLPEPLRLPVALVVGGIFAGLAGIIIAIPALRLKGDYLAIITLGFGEIIRVIILNLKFTGGGTGLRNIPYITNFSSVYWVVIITVVFMFVLMRSKDGRAILAIRENSIAAEAVGIPVKYYKLFSFTISAFFAGVAGGLYAHYISVLDAQTFGFMKSVEILVYVVLGGLGSFTGSILSATTLTILPEMLRQFSNYRLLLYSILLIVIMLIKPSGLLGKYEFSLTKSIETYPVWSKKLAGWFRKLLKRGKAE